MNTLDSQVNKRATLTIYYQITIIYQTFKYYQIKHKS
jgi:hypothetical protein